MERIHTKKRREKKTNPKQTTRKPVANPTGASLARKYSTMKTQFQATEITYQCHLFIRRIANSAPVSLQSPTLLPLLYDVSKSFFLNELQVSLWSLYLSRIVWRQTADILETLLRFAALATKIYFEDDYLVFESMARNSIAGFDEKWIQWRNAFAAELDVSPPELRTRFQELSDMPSERVKEEAVDYNQLITAILQMSPPLQASQFDEEGMKMHGGPSFLSLVCDDRKSGATAPSCSESDKGEFCMECPQDDDTFWELGAPLPRFSSLTEIWPDLLPTHPPS